VARRIGTTQRKIVASPRYLKRHGRPKTIDDLARHRCLGFNFRRANPVWSLKRGDSPFDLAINGPLLANNGETVRRMALAGVGLARLGEFNVREDLAAGRLVEVLPGAVEGVEEQVHALFLGGPRLPHRVRVFLDHVCPRLSRFLLAT
jgi:DNA-binding transcriptional LysR family regulator